MLEQNKIFDRKLYKLLQHRIYLSNEKHDFLFNQAKDSIIEKIQAFGLQFQSGLSYGHIEFEAQDFNAKKMDYSNIVGNDKQNFVYDEDEPNKIKETYDLIISSFTLHLVNNIKAALFHYKEILNENGVFVGAIFGGNTLHELRDVCAFVDVNYYNGLSSRTMPMIDIKDSARLLQYLGFKMPVADVETFQVSYSNLYHLLLDLRGMGQSNCLINRNKKYSGKQYFKLVEEEYFKRHSKNGKIIATFDIITFIGRK